jgi:hypothetical protein
MSSATTRSRRPETRQGELLLAVDVDGGMVRLRTRYEPQLVEQLSCLPGRRFVAKRGEWVLPARRDGLLAIAWLVVELGGQAQLSDRARRRLERHGPGRIDLHGGEFELRVRPRPGRLERIRAVPERRYLPERRRWRVAPTRAGALALLAVVDDGELVAAPAALARLRELASNREPRSDAVGDDVGEFAASRASPRPHWRHLTRGPIFSANPDRHEWMDGIGWCVRVRVDPERRRGREP